MGESIKGILERSYKKCFDCYNTLKSENMKQDFHQRMDEICLIYSQYFKISYNVAKEELTPSDEKVKSK